MQTKSKPANSEAEKLKTIEDLALHKFPIRNLPKPLYEASENEVEVRRSIGRITTYVLKFLSGKYVEHGFEWLLPVVFSKSTDPLWPDPGASIDKRVRCEIYGEIVNTTTSMIVHKMVACSIAFPKLFTYSPNIRIEKKERAYSGMHAYEFTQLDFEVRDASSKDIRGFVEKVLCELIKCIRNDMREELLKLGRYESLAGFEPPFEVYDRASLLKSYGKRWEYQIKALNRPVWIINIPREFYDFEDFESGFWDNYDLMLPGYGEVLSGSRREWEYGKLVRKMRRDRVREEDYALLLRLAREGKLKPTAGAGIGVERLIQWIVSANHIGEVQPFPKIPGVVYDL